METILVQLQRKKRPEKAKFDYRLFFIIGISLFATGMTLSLAIEFVIGIGLWAGGILFIIIGLANIKKWDKF